MKQPGLLEPGAQPGGTGEMPPGTNEASGLSPDQQKKFDAYVAQGVRLIHDQKVTDTMLQGIEGSENPVPVIADTTLNLIKRLDAKAAETGIELEIELKAHAANLLMGELITIAESAGMPPLDDEQRYQVFSLAVSKYLKQAVASGEMSEDELIQMGQAAQQTPEGQKIMQGLQGQGMNPGGV